MSSKFMQVGPHDPVRIVDRKDVNQRFMVACDSCKTYAHAFELSQAIEDLKNTSCSPSCQNCKNLRRSFSKSPAVPEGGTCNDRLHVCPYDGNRWWQSNGYFHLWQQVTSDREWEALNKEH